MDREELPDKSQTHEEHGEEFNLQEQSSEGEILTTAPSTPAQSQHEIKGQESHVQGQSSETDYFSAYTTPQPSQHNITGQESHVQGKSSETDYFSACTTPQPSKHDITGQESHVQGQSSETDYFSACTTPQQSKHDITGQESQEVIIDLTESAPTISDSEMLRLQKQHLCMSHNPYEDPQPCCSKGSHNVRDLTKSTPTISGTAMMADNAPGEDSQPSCSGTLPISHYINIMYRHKSGSETEIGSAFCGDGDGRDPSFLQPATETIQQQPPPSGSSTSPNDEPPNKKPAPTPPRTRKPVFKDLFCFHILYTTHSITKFWLTCTACAIFLLF